MDGTGLWKLDNREVVLFARCQHHLGLNDNDKISSRLLAFLLAGSEGIIRAFHSKGKDSRPLVGT